MRTLFELDKKNYNINGRKLVRPSVRGIIIQGDKIALVHSLKYDYYKFPGGGIDNNESHLETLIREVHEEAGLTVVEKSVKEYGMVRRIEKALDVDVFIQDNFYYLCDVKDEILKQKLDDYEAEEQFTLEIVNPETAIAVNRKDTHGSKSKLMIEREALVLELLIKEGYFKK